LLDGIHLCQVTSKGGGGMSIDVIDLQVLCELFSFLGSSRHLQSQNPALTSHIYILVHHNGNAI
jgi:hypothetical protein